MPWERNRSPNALQTGSFEEIPALADSAIARRPDYSFESDEIAGYAHLFGPPMADKTWMPERRPSFRSLNP